MLSKRKEQIVSYLLDLLMKEVFNEIFYGCLRVYLSVFLEEQNIY
jgi:hypothetical protein